MLETLEIVSAWVEHPFLAWRIWATQVTLTQDFQSTHKDLDNEFQTPNSPFILTLRFLLPPHRKRVQNLLLNSGPGLKPTLCYTQLCFAWSPPNCITNTHPFPHNPIMMFSFGEMGPVSFGWQAPSSHIKLLATGLLLVVFTGRLCQS
jgi:hypothetical protein